MKSFDELYNELNSAFREVEKKRKKDNKIIKYFLVGVILFMISPLITSKINMDDDLLIAISIAIIAIILTLIWKLTGLKDKSKITSDEKEHSYLALYKEKIVTPIIKNFFPDSNYFPFNGLLFEEYNKMPFNQEYDTYNSDDLIRANIKTKYNNLISIELADVFLCKGNLNSNDIILPVFQGLVCHVNFNQNIISYAKITSKKLMDFNGKILMDMSEFQKYFTVKTDDRITITRILTSDIMANMVAIWNKLHLDFEIIIKDNNIYLRFFTGMMFSTKIFNSAIGKKRLKNYYDILDFLNNLSIQIFNAICQNEL